jgi:hypothetical protein
MFAARNAINRCIPLRNAQTAVVETGKTVHNFNYFKQLPTGQLILFGFRTPESNARLSDYILKPAV